MYYTYITQGAWLQYCEGSETHSLLLSQGQLATLMFARAQAVCEEKAATSRPLH